MNDWPISISKLADKILSELGFSTSPSLEPGSDDRRDCIASMIAGAIAGNNGYDPVKDDLAAALIGIRNALDEAFPGNEMRGGLKTMRDTIAAYEKEKSL